MTTVGRISKIIAPNQRYCGRAGKGQDGKWGNPKPLFKESDRLADIELFHHRLFTGDLQHRLEDLEELKDKELLCFCRGANELNGKACHCDVYADICNQIWNI